MHLRAFVFFWQCADRKISTLVYAWEGFSSSAIIDIERILEDIHLWSNILTLHNDCTILELV